MRYPVTMESHGPSRTLEQYLGHLYDELANAVDARPGTARAKDLAARIRMIEDEIGARGTL